MNGNRNEIILLSVTKIYISLIVEKKKRNSFTLIQRSERDR